MIIRINVWRDYRLMRGRRADRGKRRGVGGRRRRRKDTLRRRRGMRWRKLSKRTAMESRLGRV